MLDGARAGVRSRVRPRAGRGGGLLRERKRRYEVGQEGRGQRDRKENRRQQAEMRACCSPQL